MHTARRIALVLGTALTITSLQAAEDESELSFPKGVGEVYAKLARSMREADMPTFMKVFHRDFIFEAPDGASLDRGPWRRKWLDQFELRRYEKAVFEPVEILGEEDEQVVLRTRSIVAYTEVETGVRRVREIEYEDTWGNEEFVWSLLFRQEGEVVVEGELGVATGAAASPRIGALAKLLATGEEDKLNALWKELREKGGPLVEPIVGSKNAWVTFVWRGDGSESSVGMTGGWPSRERLKPLSHLRGTELWYRAERYPLEARFTYSFYVQKEVGLPAFDGEPAEVLVVGAPSADPFNSRKDEGASLVELAGAPALTFLNPDATKPEGTIERHTVRSAALGERRFVSVYTPPGYDSQGAVYPAVFLLDGGSYASRRTTGVVLDNLIAAKKIPPLVAFLIHSEGSRRQELEVSKEFLEFLGEELIPWSREKFHLSKKPEDGVIGGNRLGSTLAVMCAADHPDVFGGVLSEGGNFSADLAAPLGEEGQTVAARLSELAKLPLRFWVTVGVLDGEPVVGSNRHLRDVLRAKDYVCEYSAKVGNHNTAAWLEALARGLEVLLAR